MPHFPLLRYQIKLLLVTVFKSGKSVSDYDKWCVVRDIGILFMDKFLHHLKLIYSQFEKKPNEYFLHTYNQICYILKRYCCQKVKTKSTLGFQV